MTDPAGPHELPPAYVPPAYIAPASALDQPALGLVLAFAALLTLPQSTMLLVQVLLLDMGDGKVIALGALMSASALLQLAAGVAIAWQWRHRAAVFFVAVACGMALVMCAFTLWRDELPWRAGTVMMLETLGGPLLVVLAPRLFGLRRIARGHALGGLLIASGASTLIYEAPYVLDQARMFLASDATIGTWLGEGLRAGAVIATSVLQLLAGLRMARGQGARRYLVAYVIVALAGVVGIQLFGIVYWLADRDEEHIKYLMATMVINVVVAVIRPVLVWQFAKQESEPGPRVDAALPWIALWFAPQLAARCLLREDAEELLGSLTWPLVALCGAQAIACIVAARASLRGEHGVVTWRVAAAVALVLLALVVYWVFFPHDLDNGPWRKRSMFNLSQLIWPVALLFGTMATGAWLAARGRSEQ